LNAPLNPAYSYQWELNGTEISGATSNTLNASSAGDYRVKVSESSTCFWISAPFQLTVNPLPPATITASGNTTFCQGNSVSLNANSGTGLSYQWFLNADPITGATNSSYSANAQGIYSVQVLNSNGCSALSNSLTITVKSLPVATISGSSVLCQGSSTILSANTGTGRTYQWKRNNINVIGATAANYTVVTAGTYTVVVTANGCASTSNAISVASSPVPTVTVTVNGATTFCQGDSTTLTANTAPSNTLQWRRNGTAIAGATNNSLVVSTSGNYTVTVASLGNCSSTSTATSVTVTPQPPAPSGLACYETALFNVSTCSWSVSGTQPPAPTGLACYQSATFDSVSCTWIVSGTPNPVDSTVVTVCDTQYVWQANNQAYTSSGNYSYYANCQEYSLQLTLNTPAIIISQPSNVGVTQFANTTMQVVAYSNPGANNNLTYQWQRSINGAPFQNVTNNALFSGSQSPVLNITALSTSLDGNLFRCVVNGACGNSAVSNPATLTVVPSNPVTLSIGSSSICSNGNAQSVSVPVTADNFNSIASMTFELSTGQGLSFVGLANRYSGLVGLNSNLVNGNIRISWYNSTNISLPNGTVLFDLVFNTSASGNIDWNNNYAYFFDEYNGARLVNLNNGNIGTYPSSNPTVSNPGVLCVSGSPVLLSVSPQGGTLSGPGVSGNLFDPTLSGAGFHTVTYTYTAPNGCTESVNQIVEVTELPNGSAGSDVDICPGTSTTLTASGGDAYLWSTNETTPFITVSPGSSTLYTVTIFNTAGCFIVDTVVVNISNTAGITINAGDTVSICAGASSVLNTTGAAQAIWSPSVGLSSTSDLNPVASPSITTMYYVVGISAAGCVTTDSVLVVVNPIPVPAFTIPATICVNQSSVDLLGTPGGGTFSGPGVVAGTRCNGCPPVFEPSLAGVGIHTIVYTYTDPSTGCSGTASQSIEVLGVPTVSAGLDQNICSGQSAILTASGGSSYLWSNGATGSSISVSPSSTTVYTVSVSGANGCTVTDDVVVTVLPSPTAQVSGSRQICPNGTTQLTVSGFNTVVWSPSTGINDPTSLSPVFSPASTTTYVVYGTDVNGCSGTDTVTITVLSAPVVSAGDDMIACGNAVTLTATGPSGSSFAWNNGQNTASVSVNPSVTTTYSVTVTDPSGCVASDSVTVFVPIMFTGGNRSICKGNSTNLLASLSNYPGSASNLSYSWTPGTGLSNTAVSNPTASPNVTTVYTVTIVDALSNCTYSRNVVVVVLPTPEVNLGASNTIAPGGSIQLAASLQNITSGAVYNWTLLGTNHGSINQTGNTANATFTAGPSNSLVTQLIVLTVTNGNGCQGIDTVEITIDPLLAGKTLGGSILYANSISSPINSGTVTLTGPSGAARSTNIGPGGTYLFTAVLDSSYTLRTQIDKIWGGITVADAQLINDHINNSILSGIDTLAADVTGDGLILANDAQQTARRAAALTINNSFDNGTGPGNWVNSSQAISMQGADLIANLQVLAYGDVNRSYSPILRAGTVVSWKENTVFRNHRDKELIQVPMIVGQTLSLGSLQFEFEVPQGGVLEKVSSNELAGEILWNQRGTKCMVLWFHANNDKPTVVEGKTLLTLSFLIEPNKRAEMNSFVIRPNGYHEFNDSKATSYGTIRLETNKIQFIEPQDIQVEVYPNPASNASFVTLNLPENQCVSIKLTDLSGRVIQLIQSPQLLRSGSHTFNVSTEDLSSGHYLITVEGASTLGSIKRKLVVSH
jgi:hypothetical protein